MEEDESDRLRTKVEIASQKSTDRKRYD